MEMQSFEKFVVNNSLVNFLYVHYSLPKVFHLVDGEVGSQVLEIGCGLGYTTAEILRCFPQTEVVAIDYDLEQVRLAHERLAAFGRRVRVQQGDATALQFADNSFDAAFEFRVFHHIRDYQKAIAEVARVLKPGGTFYAMDISQSFFMLPFVRALFPPEVLFTKEEFVQQLTASGLRVRKVTGKLTFCVAAGKAGQTDGEGHLGADGRQKGK